MSWPTHCSKGAETCVCGSGSASSNASASVRPCTFCARDVNQSKLSCLRDEKRKEAFFMKAKKLVALLMAVVLMVGIFAVPAMAAAEDSVSPHTCQHSSTSISVTETGWQHLSSWACTHNKNGVGADRREMKQYITRTICDYCGDIVKTSTRSEYRTYCSYQNKYYYG